MIDRSHDLPIVRQAELVGISPGSVYYLPQPVSASDLVLTRRMDAMHVEHPFAGARTLRDWLLRKGHAVGRKHVAALMRRMAISAQHLKPRTSRRNRQHKVYPYLLRNRSITAPNHVWAMDITYIPMARGFVNLAAVMDWCSRRVLAWRVSKIMDTGFRIEAVEEALSRFGKPEIFDTDQGSQLTSDAFVGLLRQHGIAISMVGKRCWRDNVFVERLWRSSSTRRSTVAPTIRSRTLARRSPGTSSSTTAGAPTRALSVARPMSVYFKRQPLPMAVQPKRRGTTYRTG